MFCRFCGTEISDDSTFCIKCGRRVGQVNNALEKETFSADDYFDDFLEPVSSERITNNDETNKNFAFDESILKALQVNGSANVWTHYYDGKVYIVNVDEKVRTSDGIYIHYNGTYKKILEGIAVDSFKINSKYNRIIFKKQEKGRKFSLWACDTDGLNKAMIAGGNDDVYYFDVTYDWIFAVVKNKNDDKFIYQISTGFRQATVIKKNVDIRRPIAADDEYLYYAISCESGRFNPDKMGIIQYDISKKTERFIIKNIGISAFQLYHKYIIVSTYKNCMWEDEDDTELKIIDLQQMLIRPLAKKISPEIMNVYLNHVFYADKKTGYLYALRIKDRTTHLIYNRSIAHIELSSGLLHVIDTKKEQMVLMGIFDFTRKKVEGYTGYTIPVADMKTADTIPKYAGKVKELPSVDNERKEEIKHDDKKLTSVSTEQASKTQTADDKVKPDKQTIKQFKYEIDNAWRKHRFNLAKHNILKIITTIIGFGLIGGIFILTDEGELFYILLCIIGIFIDIAIWASKFEDFEPDDVKKIKRNYNEKYDMTRLGTPPGCRGFIYGGLVLLSFTLGAMSSLFLIY